MTIGLYLLFHGLLSTVLVCTTWVYSMAMDRQIPEVIGHAVGSIPEQIFEAVALKYDLTTKPASPQYTPLPKQNIKYRPTPLTIPFATGASVSLSDVVEAETFTWTTITIEHRPTDR
ncbi:hypothetical protein F5051DRAFT_446177 [Lentinula edodes]|nr:hypothetical protein F5051DRAFT_446177 [Lentinula edodes]